ncbi:MAG: hypothetical protein JNL88_02255 [Bacteroidia bacterium]|nr:hypothetical protein [Bacteroidia bacterium]
MKAWLSKTGYIKGRQCLKALYLYKYHFKKRDPLSPERKARFQRGHSLGVRARELFPGGVDATPSSIFQYTKSVEETRALIREGVSTIYEAAFLYQGALIYCDILVKDKGEWHLYEVKSSEHISPVYCEDLALQYFVLCGTGMIPGKAGFIHLSAPLHDTDDQAPAASIFRISDYTEFCKMQCKNIEMYLGEMKKTLAAPRIPAIEMGVQCNQPYPCDFTGFCSRQNHETLPGLFATP